MELLTSPKGWIAIGTVIGLVVGGLPGMAVGFVGSLLLTLLVGLMVNAVSGGAVPKKVRRQLVAAVVNENPAAVRAAFPEVGEAGLSRALENEVEETIKTAVTISPSHEAIFAENVIRAALRQRMLEEPDPARQEILRILGERLLRDWYGGI